MDTNATAQVAQAAMAQAEAVRVIGETLNRLSDNMEQLRTVSTQQQEQLTIMQQQQASMLQAHPIASSTPFSAPSSQAPESGKNPRIATYDGSASFAFDDWS